MVLLTERLFAILWNKTKVFKGLNHLLIILKNFLVLKIHSSVQLHRSSIETIDVLRENCDLNGDIADLNDETLILSGGGRSELLCWQLDLHSFHFYLIKFIFSKNI